MDEETLRERIGRVKETLKRERPTITIPSLAELNKMRNTKHMAKKVVKKGAKKVAVKKSSSNGSDLVTVADLAEEAGITAQRARQKLREAELAREGRWKFEKGSRLLADARKALGI